MFSLLGGRERAARESLRAVLAGDAAAGARALMPALGIAPESGPAPDGGALRRVLVRDLQWRAAPPEIVFQYAALMERLGLRLLGVRAGEGRLTLAVEGPEENSRRTLNALLVARSVVLLALEALPSVGQVEIGLWCRAGGRERACVFSALADRARVRVVDVAALRPAQLARVFDVRAAEGPDGLLAAITPHTPSEEAQETEKGSAESYRIEERKGS